MTKRILYLSFYFEPDLCAGSFRNSPLAHELAQQALKKDITVDVVTTLPNRYNSYSTEALEESTYANLHIKRIKIPGHQSGVRDQMRSFRVFFDEVNKYVKDKQYNLVYASSSRLFTAYLGYRIAKRMGVPLYLDIRDIFVDTIKDVFPNPLIKSFVIPFLKFIEYRTFNYASHINLISGGFREYFSKYKKAVFSFFTNGIDPIFLAIPQTINDSNGEVKTIVYAGNIGEGQGLHKIVPEAAKLLEGRFRFKVIGDGGAKIKLEKRLKELNINNVELAPPVNRESLLKEYDHASFLFIHLNDYEAFKKVLPSKVFELGVYPKPLIAGVNGFSRNFIKENLPDAIIIDPCDSKALAEKLLAYNIQDHDRTEFIEMFKRETINKEMASSILSYL